MVTVGVEMGRTQRMRLWKIFFFGIVVTITGILMIVPKPDPFWDQLVDLLSGGIILVLWWMSIGHVYRESKTNKRVGHAFGHALMVALLWPWAYLGWILWWPGSLRQFLFGSDQTRAEKRVREYLDKKRSSCV
jgi:hypothetical protein